MLYQELQTLLGRVRNDISTHCGDTAALVPEVVLEDDEIIIAEMADKPPWELDSDWDLLNESLRGFCTGSDGVITTRPHKDIAILDSEAAYLSMLHGGKSLN